MIKHNRLSFSPDGIAKVDALINADSSAFSDLVKIANISKERDLIGADLTGVDFSGADLRGYNFTDTDLTGSVGRDVLVDNSTILDRAIVDGSIFALEVEKRNYLKRNPEHQALLNRIKQDYWASGSLWVSKNLRKTSRNFKTAAAVAKFAYDEIKDTTYKNQILYHLKDTFNNKEEYRDFLIYQASKNDINFRVLRTIIDLLAKQFRSDAMVSNFLISFLSHERPDIRALCIPAVVGKSFFRKHRNEIVRQMHTESSHTVRIRYSQYICRSVLPHRPTLLYRDDLKAFHDYSQPIDERILEILVRGQIKTAKKVTSENVRFKGRPTGAVSQIKQADVERALAKYTLELRTLISAGLPLTLKSSAGARILRPALTN